MPEAFSAATQRFAGELLTPLEAARAAGLEVQVSASLMQARILAKLQADLLPGCRTPAQAALQFARSCPGVATALCGMSSPGHVAENLELLRLPKADRRELEALAG
jgi:aryl-alcohol dehydrogenase-like predicted oxidoreductase